MMKIDPPIICDNCRNPIAICIADGFWQHTGQFSQAGDRGRNCVDPRPMPPEDNVWMIHEGFYIQQTSWDMLEIRYEPDDTGILVPVDHIDDIIDALGRVKSHFAARELAEAQAEALARWGKEKTPGEVTK